MLVELVEGLAVCDWAVGQARAGRCKQIPPSTLLGKQLTRVLAGGQSKLAYFTGQQNP